MKQGLKAYHKPGRMEAGCDEAGRGCLAGPVVAAAVILPQDFVHPLLNDSKQLTEAQRDTLRPIIEAEALAWSVAFMDERYIEEHNILNASIDAMHAALNGLQMQPDFILIDGNRFRPYQEIPHDCIIKGDGIYRSIAAASILAKTHRDEYMLRIHASHPVYGWDRNKGYPTQQHRSAIRLHGACAHHRSTFQLLPEQLALSFES
ncbi:MAG: ribonuclease HII [Flavobacteriales bacterium]